MGKHKRDTLYLGSLGTERHPNFAIRNYEKDQGSVRGGVWVQRTMFSISKALISHQLLRILTFFKKNSRSDTSRSTDELCLSRSNHKTEHSIH